ncbi:hypothetical protein KTQ54_05655 [Komagataeibacter oboediens]|uniref:hypothetical protein n=1 Tax=Komagataeibacter oboediens TaxID=65958 RepID=UPI001C2BEEDC|nr:hypothetical protein [Komagataeibacter oboediens]MBV0888026.1 hypothetical protein [Komagataeibacter oboediens]MCK9819131.1 hypothetical protein [Komagataeibacter oboediens]
MSYRPIITLPVMTIGLMLAGGGLPAMARDMAAPPATAIPQAMIDAAPGARLAGYLNFCIGNGLADHAGATPLLDTLIHNTGAVPSDERGNMDYAYGTAGVLQPGTHDSPRMTDFDIPVRRDACAQAIRKAGMGA